MKEEDIRPREIFEEYLQLCEQDTRDFFGDSPREPLPCPACGARGEPAFVKQGFTYEACPACLTLFVSPRPVPEAFSRYYTESTSARYWATTFYRATAEARRVKLWQPKARMVHDILRAQAAAESALIDIGGGYGLFAQEMQRLTGKSVTVIEPGPALAEACRAKGLSVIEDFLEQLAPSALPAGPRVFTSFELFEHLHDPALFLNRLKSLMGSGDLFIFTTLSGTGADIQALWQDSKSVSPPHHLNFFNPASVRLLLEQVGFHVVDVTTPGKLDIDIIINNRQFIKDRFWRAFAALASESCREKWQEMLAGTGWSSHMLVVCRHP
jgi:hypothetical protein